MLKMKTIRSRWSSTTKIVIVLLLLALAIYLFSQFSVVAAPLVISIILAYILSPVANFLQARWRIPRWLATLLSYLLLLVGISAILMVIVPLLVAQFSGLNVDLQMLVNEIEKIVANQYVIAGQSVDLSTIFQQAIGTLQGVMEPVFGQTLGFAVEVITSLAWIVFILVISFYLIKDAQAVKVWVESLVPQQYKDDFLRLRETIGQLWSAFFRGQLSLAVVVAVIISLVGLAIGLPFALAMGFLAGLLEIFPTIGHGIWLLIASLLALFSGSTWLPLPNWAFMLIVIGLHLVFQQFDLNYLIPRIIGRRVHLPPLVVILGIISGAALAGFLGILLAAPTIASARVLGRYIYANLFDLDPFPEPAATPLPPPNPRWWRGRADQLEEELVDNPPEEM